MTDLVTNNSLGGALQTAVKGMQKTGNDFHQAATDVVNNGVEASNAINVANNPELASETFLSTASHDTPSLESSVINMMQAQRSYEANLAVFKVADELQEELLDIKS